MKRRQFNLGGLAAASLASLTSRSIHAQQPTGWEVLANIAESCSCEIPCPCNFGLPTTLTCHGSRLIEITGGHMNGRPVAGISFVVTFDMGNWTKLYVDESLSDDQFATFEALLPQAFAGFDRGKVGLVRSPVEVERGDGRVRFSVSESTVEMELLRGLDGEPIRISGLPSNMFFGYTQYRSRVHRHSSNQVEFSYDGSNAFTSRMVASSGAA